MNKEVSSISKLVQKIRLESLMNRKDSVSTKLAMQVNTYRVVEINADRLNMLT